MSSNPNKREKSRNKSNSEIEEMGEDETSGFLEEEELSDLEEDKVDNSKFQEQYSPFQLVGDVIGCCRSLVRLSIICTGIYQHLKWRRYSFVIIEFIIIYTSSLLQLLNRDTSWSWKSILFSFVGPLYSTFSTVWSHAKCIWHGIRLQRSKKQNLHGKFLQIEMEHLARRSAIYWMTEDAMLLGTSCLFLTLAHQADWLEFPIPNKFFLTKSINQVCSEAKGVTSLNLPEWVLCFVRLLLPFFGAWPMDYLFITRIWILLWSCMWACDFIDFSWTLFIFPSVKGKRFRPGPLPQLYQAANRLMELGFRTFGIVLSSSVMVPMIFRGLTTSRYRDEDIYLHALYSRGFQHYNASYTVLNNTINPCIERLIPFEDCDSYQTIDYNLQRDIHDVKKMNKTIVQRENYSDIFQAVDAAIVIYCVIVFLLTLIYHMMLEYAKWSFPFFKMREFHVVFQKSVLFSPYSRLTWRKRQVNSCDDKYKSVYISLQIASFPLLLGLFVFSFVDIDYDEIPSQPNLSSSTLWKMITTSSGYPGGVFNYSSKYFHYYLQTNIYFVTLFPALIFFSIFSFSVNCYFKLLQRIRNYEFSLYRAKYSAMYGAYR